MIHSSISITVGGGVLTDESLVRKAHELFLIFKCLFADLILSFRDPD